MNKSEVSEGVLVQKLRPSLKDGVVISTNLALKDRPSNYYSLSRSDRLEFDSTAKIKWDDGTESVEDITDIFLRDSVYEREFRKISDIISDKIYEKVKAAQKLLDEAVEISEKSGVPFNSGISFIGQSYIPKSLSVKFPDIDKEFINEVTETWGDFEYGGWEHSAVC